MTEDLDSERVVINVGGTHHETLRSTLRSFPGTRLSRLEADSPQSEFFFDRDPRVFSYVLNYYRTGRLHCPGAVCASLVQDELTFWGLDEADLEACCWRVYHRHRPQLPQGDGGEGGDRGRAQGWKQRIWDLFEEPFSSTRAMAVAILSLLFILTSILLLLLSSHQSFHKLQVIPEEVTIGNSTSVVNSYDVTLDPALFKVECVCVAFFTFEFIVRFFTCPNKLSFIKNVMNIADFVAILPFYLELLLHGWISRVGVDILGFLRIARIIRLLRVFRLMPRCVGLRVIGQTMIASIPEISLLVLFLSIGLLIFATSMYYAELFSADIDDPTKRTHTNFKDIPVSIWWAVVTMTTLGYGDMYPETGLGMLVGVLCALSAVLTIAMPIPVLMNNYSRFYELEMAKDKRPKKKEKRQKLKDSAQSEV